VLRQAMAAEDTAVNASLLILLRAVDRFWASCGRFPGTHEGYRPRPHHIHLHLPKTGLHSPVPVLAANLSNTRRGLMIRALTHALEMGPVNHSAHVRLLLNRQLEDDAAVLKARMASVAADCGVSAAAVPDDYVEEMVRFGASELHVTGAIMGGIAAQETIKFITHQFVPVPGTLIYNAMASTSSVFVL
jgi:hypothetical protein